MKRLIDGEEDDVVGYQAEGYGERDMITKRATNQSARCGLLRNAGARWLVGGCWRNHWLFYRRGTNQCQTKFIIILLLVVDGVASTNPIVRMVAGDTNQCLGYAIRGNLPLLGGS
jgi:hypothetical protein